MKPMKLILSAFGSYAGEEVIDFDCAKRGVFLITGDTGAGKTTIFDAITYALYDQTSGGRREGIMMRSQFASPETPTFVELMFSYQGQRYQVRRNPSYSRPSKRRNKAGELTYTTEGAAVSLILPDGKEFPGRIREINEKIIEILGVSKEQFTQVAMIAQGEFIRLLHAASKDRKEIFARIFDTGIYAKLQQHLREMSKSLYGQLEDNCKLCLHEIEGVQCQADSPCAVVWEESKGLLETNPGQILDVLGQILEEQQEREKQLRQQAENLQKQQQENHFQLRQAQEISRLFAEAQQADILIEQRQKELEQLRKKEQQKREEAETLRQRFETQLPKLSEHIAALKNLLPKYAKIKEQQKVLQQANAQRQTTVESVEKLTRQIAKAEENIEKLETDNQCLTEETQQLPELLQKEKELADHKKMLEEMDRTNQNWQQAQAEQKKGQKKLQNLSNDYQEKSRAHDELYRAFVEEQAGLLAQDLQVGQPCPVCGSLEHPKKAELSREAVTKQQVEQAKQRRERANSDLEKYREQFQKIQEHCEQQKVLLFRDGQRLFGEEFQIENIEPAWAASKEEYQETRQKLEQLKQKAVQLEQQKETLKQCKNSHAKLKEQQEQQKEIQSQAILAVEKAQQALQLLQAELPFPTEKELQTQLVREEKEKQALETQRTNLEQNLQRLRQNIAQNQGTLSEQIKNRTALEQQLQDKEPPEMPELMAQAGKLEQKAQFLEQERRRLISQIDRNTEAKRNLTQQYLERERLKGQYELMGNLDRTANGNLAQHVRMDLQTYVQRRYFKYMVEEANRRLIKMNGEQFLLQCRELEQLGRQGEVGLDLDVYDLVTDQVRDVKTLSGGESFLAALAMALGMADVIQKNAGKVHLDTMFIDEGFGSLDEEARQRAIGILNEMAGDTKLVGIISHVTELKEQMDRKLVIKKSDKGSHAHWVLES